MKTPATGAAPSPPRVTVITPAYNRAATLPRAIESVLAQTFADWELVIVDDGSTDRTVAVAESYADDRIRIVRHAQNRGVAAAKNTGYDEIRGEYFTTLDSDDEARPEALERMLAVVDSHPEIDQLVCNAIDADTGAMRGSGLDAAGPIDESSVVLTGDFWSLTRTATLGASRHDPALAGFEEVLWYELAERQHRFFIPDALLVVHHDAEKRVTTAGRGSRYQSFVVLLDRREDHIERVSRRAPEVRARFWFDAGLEFAWMGDRARTRRALDELVASGGSTFGRAALLRLGLLGGPLIFRPTVLMLLGARNVVRNLRARRAA